MDSSNLYHIKQQFILGAYKSLVDSPSPDPSSTDYVPTLVYKARSLIALGENKSVPDILPSGNENVALKAVAVFARYVEEKTEEVLEELRDLAIEIEDEDVEGTDRDKDTVRVIAGTAFAIAGEVEEALETLGSDTEDLEAVAIIIQIYLSINRTDMAKKEFERCKQWAEDDLLLQLIESNIHLVTGKDSYNDTLNFYTEQLGNPSLTSPHILTARGVSRILRNEFTEAKSDLEEALSQQPGDAETLAALVVAASFSSKRKDAEELWSRLQSEHPSHPLVHDMAEKSDLFDTAVAKLTVPALPVVSV